MDANESNTEVEQQQTELTPEERRARLREQLTWRPEDYSAYVRKFCSEKATRDGLLGEPLKTCPEILLLHQMLTLGWATPESLNTGPRPMVFVELVRRLANGWGCWPVELVGYPCLHARWSPDVPAATIDAWADAYGDRYVGDALAGVLGTPNCPRTSHIKGCEKKPIGEVYYQNYQNKDKLLPASKPYPNNDIIRPPRDEFGET